MTAVILAFRGNRRSFLRNLYERMEVYDPAADSTGHHLRSYIRDSGINLFTLARSIELNVLAVTAIQQGKYRHNTPYLRERIKRLILAHLTFEYMMAS
jgi:hypothetical protein